MVKTDKLVQQGSVFVAISILGMILNFLFTMFMIRGLGQYDYGIFETLLRVLTILAVPCSVIPLTIARFLAQYSARGEYDKIQVLLRSALLSTLIIGIIGGLLLFIGKDIILNILNIQLDSAMPMLVITLIFTFGWILPVLRGGLQGLQKFTMLGLNIFSDSSVRLIVGIILVYAGYKVSGAIGASLVVVILGIILSIIPLAKYIKKPEHQAPKIEMKSILFYAIPVLLYFYGKELFASLDLFMVSKYLTDWRGVYATGSVIGSAFWTLPAAIITVMFPMVAHTHAKHESPMHLIQKSLLFSGLLCIIGIAVCFIAPQLVIRILCGTRYPIDVMVSLLKWFSVCVTPFALANVLLNYHLAKADYECVYILIGGVIIHAILFWLFHNTVYQVLSIVCISGVLQIIANYWLLVHKENKARVNDVT
ncbi:MAG: oligosaccharide flippase family protein [bacterium]